MPPLIHPIVTNREHRPSPQRTSPEQAAPPDGGDSGMIVLSSSFRVLHMNRRARALMRLFGEAHELWPNLAPESMPTILSEFCRDILAELERRRDMRDWAQFEIRRVCHMVTPALLLRGFGVPAMANREPQMILTLQPCGTSSAPAQYE